MLVSRAGAFRLAAAKVVLIPAEVSAAGQPRQSMYEFPHYLASATDTLAAGA